MTECVLFSDNTDVIKNFNSNLRNTSISFENLPLSELAGFDPDSTPVIIIDVSKTGENDMIKSLKSVLVSYKNKKIMILKQAQAEYLVADTSGFDDFIFLEDMDSDLIFRIKFNLSKMKALSLQNSLVVDKLVLNLEKYELVVEGVVVVLTFKEFEMLKLLMQNKNKVFTRTNLLSQVWGYDYYGGSRTVDVHMRRLRSKIPPPYNNMLKTIRNVGYMFAPSE